MKDHDSLLLYYRLRSGWREAEGFFQHCIANSFYFYFFLYQRPFPGNAILNNKSIPL